jgi:mannosyltransferase OCH1-like enzyme
MIYIIILLILLILFIILNKYISNHQNINSEINENYTNEKIPYILFKTGPYDIPTNELETIFNKNKDKLKIKKVYYYNDNECDQLMESMGYNVLKAYNMLIPTAYKADLWRYCVLYKYGGIYGDMTQLFYKNYDVNYSNVDMVLVRDIKDDAMQISFMATIPKNNFYKYLITCITTDIFDKKKGRCPLDITGPRAFCRYFCKFFEISSIRDGIYTLKGLDNNYYKIRIDLRQYPGLIFRNIFDQKIIASTKNKNHNKNLVIITKTPKYSKLYFQNKIFK